MPYIAREEDYLAHHGIKGMRWGVRKDRSTGGGIRGKKKLQTMMNLDLQSELLNPREEKVPRP